MIINLTEETANNMNAISAMFPARDQFIVRMLMDEILKNEISARDVLELEEVKKELER